VDLDLTFKSTGTRNDGEICQSRLFNTLIVAVWGFNEKLIAQTEIGSRLRDSRTYEQPNNNFWRVEHFTQTQVHIFTRDLTKFHRNNQTLPNGYATQIRMFKRINESYSNCYHIHIHRKRMKNRNESSHRSVKQTFHERSIKGVAEVFSVNGYRYSAVGKGKARLGRN
jgi:hypothetical protein